MQVVLVMFRVDGERRSFSIVRDMTVIGRREDCDLRIPLGDVSRKHCRLIKDGDVVRLEDLGSSNGTYHNGVRVQEAVLSPGDAVRVGNVDFVVQIDGVPADEELVHPSEQQAMSAADEAEFAVAEDEAGAALGNDAGVPTGLVEAAAYEAGADEAAGADEPAEFEEITEFETTEEAAEPVVAEEASTEGAANTEQPAEQVAEEPLAVEFNFEIEDAAEEGAATEDELIDFDLEESHHGQKA